MEELNTLKFYEDFYDENRVRVLQYESLRANFAKLVDNVLGEDYYNMAMDVYESDRICCEDIEAKTIGFWRKFTNKRIKP